MKLAWDSKRQTEREGAKSSGKYFRERSDDLYHSARWTRFSKAWRATHPLCAECMRKGIIKEGEVTDHIIPFPVCGDFFDETNFQTLCEKCNNEKGQRDKEVIRNYRREKF